jgi:hypothetical protein
MGIKAQTQLVRPHTSILKLVPQTQRNLRTTWNQTVKIRSMPISPIRHDHRSIHRRLSTLRTGHKRNRHIRENTAQ